jgi:hypothetical protein
MLDCPVEILQRILLMAEILAGRRAEESKRPAEVFGWRRSVPGDMKSKGGNIRMRVFGAAAIIALVLAGPAYGQAKAPAAPVDPPKSPQEIANEKASESAYKHSLGNIPDQPPADPWGNARGTDAPKAAAKVQTKRTKTGSTTPN